MRHALPIVAILALGTPAAAQTVDADGARQLADTLSRYVGARLRQGHRQGRGRRRRLQDRHRPRRAGRPVARQQDVVKFDFAPYALRVKPRSDGTWDVSGGLGPDGSFEFEGPEGRQRMAWTIANGELTGIYDPELATFASAKGSYSAHDHDRRGHHPADRSADRRRNRRDEVGKSATGGIEFSSTQTFTDFVERVTISDGGSRLQFTVKAPDVTFAATGSGSRSKALLDLLAFAVANADEAKIKANQAELKSLAACRAAALGRDERRLRGERHHRGDAVRERRPGHARRRHGVRRHHRRRRAQLRHRGRRPRSCRLAWCPPGACRCCRPISC